MTQEEKYLLLKDLSARLPYKPIVQIDGCGIWNLRGIDHDDSAKLRDSVIVWRGKNYPSSKTSFPIIECKPYLFPMSSITDKRGTPLEINEYGDIKIKDNFYGRDQYTDLEIYLEVVSWLNKNYFDYHGLIEMGLAIDATGLNIY